MVQKFGLRLFAVLMMIVMCLSFVGCQKESVITEEDPSKVPEEPYEINWYMYGSTLNDVASVEKEINEYLKDKINATVKINRMEASQYREKMSNMIQTGEYFDMCFISSGMLDFNVNAENGAFVAFDDLFEKYMPKSYKLLEPEILDCVRVADKVYGFPVIKENAMAYGWVYRKDIADKYGIDMSKIKTFEDLEPVLKTIKEKDSEIKYPIDWTVGATPGGIITEFTVLGANHLGYVKGDDTYRIVDKYELPEVLEGYKLSRKFYNDGLVKPDILTNYSDYIQRLKNGQTFCSFIPLKPGKADELFKNTNYEFDQEYVIPAYKTVTAGTGSMVAISSTSKNYPRVARFIELLNTDEYLYNLVVYGIEGKHYKMVSDKVVEVIPDGGYTMSGSQWTMGNVYLSYTTVEENPDKNVLLKEFDDSAAAHPLSGFKFVTENVQAQLAACQAVDKQYESQVCLGALDPEPILKKYLEELKIAGIDDIKAELQKQVDEFLKTNK